jgi:hypothetical protein
MALGLIYPVNTTARGADAPLTRSYNFNSEWKLFVGDASGAQEARFDDSAWKPVTLPHAWNEDAAFKVSIEELSTGIAWYRKHFKLPRGGRGQARDPRVPGHPSRRRILRQRQVDRPARERRDGFRIGRHERSECAG